MRPLPRLLKRGDRGPAVGVVQKLLHVEPTCIFGPTTQDAVARFQARRGLTVDGIVGPRTWAALHDTAPPRRVLPHDWLPTTSWARRIIVHWTAGGHWPNSWDLRHYHFVIDGAGRPHRGGGPIGVRLQHTRNLNTGSIGVALAGMAGARQSPFSPGRAPITEIQWDRAAQACAELALAYRIPVTPAGVLTHAEVSVIYGRLDPRCIQRGKWDIDVLPFAPQLSPAQVRADFRRRAAVHLARLRGVL